MYHVFSCISSKLPGFVRASCDPLLDLLRLGFKKYDKNQLYSNKLSKSVCSNYQGKWKTVFERLKTKHLSYFECKLITPTPGPVLRLHRKELNALILFSEVFLCVI